MVDHADRDPFGDDSVTYDELELARLRRELADALRTRDEERANFIKRLRALAATERAAENARSRLATIIDEQLGPQEVLGLDDLLTRLEHLLHERGRQHEEALRERDALRAGAEAWHGLPPDERALVVIERITGERDSARRHADEWRQLAEGAQADVERLTARLHSSRDERAWLVAAVRVLATQVEWGTDTMDAVDMARALLFEVM